MSCYERDIQDSGDQAHVMRAPPVIIKSAKLQVAIECSPGRGVRIKPGAEAPGIGDKSGCKPRRGDRSVARKSSVAPSGAWTLLFGTTWGFRPRLYSVAPPGAQTRGKPHAIVSSVLTLALLLICSPPAYSQSSTKSIVQKVGLDQRLNAQVPLDLTFRDEQGRTVRLGDYFHDKPVVLTLVYYRCPMLCTQVLNGLLESSQAVKLTMGADYHVVSVSIDPRETISMARAKKKRYAESYHRPGADEGWHFLTGTSAAIEQLTKAAGYRYVYDPKTDQYAHASGIVILTPSGRISRYLYGIDYAPDDLKLALVEASEQRIGSLSDRFLLLCYHYDPATGKYGFAIENAIRAAGVATMVVMGGFLWLMFLRERRRTRATVKRETVQATANSVQE
ncbi:MAG: uncharacterized protein JWN70_5219 [Planctomycetaceae bacterium]|nr:uncharacterized protein [Planctomycetaceae bacterium]